jgi:uncharacterized protein (DUF849 family)
MINRPTQTILTCAITGGDTDPEKTPYLPITPEQIATSALEAADAGAAVVHIHVRDPDSGRSAGTNFELFADTVDRIRKHNNQVLINLTGGPGGRFYLGKPILHHGDNRSFLLPASMRTRHIEKLRPDLCSICFNTMELSHGGFDINHSAIVQQMLERVQAAGVKPELEIYDSGDFRIAQEMIKQGRIKGAPLWNFVMGVKYGWDSSYEALDYAQRQLPANSLWAAFAISREEMPFVAMTHLMGGHVRVGLEDNIYLSKDVLAKTNAELVAKARRIVEDLGGNLATYAEAREIYGI